MIISFFVDPLLNNHDIWDNKNVERFSLTTSPFSPNWIWRHSNIWILWVRERINRRQRWKKSWCYCTIVLLPGSAAEDHRLTDERGMGRRCFSRQIRFPFIFIKKKHREPVHLYWIVSWKWFLDWTDLFSKLPSFVSTCWDWTSAIIHKIVVQYRSMTSFSNNSSSFAIFFEWNLYRIRPFIHIKSSASKYSNVCFNGFHYL